ncbi:Vacuolar protein sorting-associated protein 13B [Papilio machaon]|uniref:Vacuolar protein sorting-associated protein 13B n=1 Tax=Papilio machaon TaxID=76193 RepID=A0A194QL71_PAPMA|nr:Vacuolar protein sorting-associated protein 13B [Papilio machaon]
MPKWCVPVGVVSGEQLVQLAGLTVKLRVRTSPHSTLLDIQHVQQHDISASDIRQRLVGSFSNSTLHEKHIDEHRSMERVNATENLMETSSSRLRNNFISRGNFNIKDDLISQSSDTNTIQSLNVKELSVDVERGANAQFSSRGLERELTRSVLAVGIEDNSQVSIVQCLSEADQSSFKELLYGGEQQQRQQQQQQQQQEEGGDGGGWGLGGGERALCEVRGVHIRLAAAADRPPLVALHLDNLLALNHADMHRGRATISVSSLQIDNAQYSSGEYDFAVVATSRAPLPPAPRWPPLWGTAPPQQSSDQDVLNLDIITEAWFVAEQEFCEITEVEVRVGALALYIEDAYVRRLAALLREAWPARDSDECAHVLAAARRVQRPLRLRTLTVMPIDLLLTLHTAAHMYIALDQSPLRLAAFRQRAMVTSVERLTHAFTVHYLSAALLSAGWVVGGLELVGAPVALAARVVGAGGGVRGVASATAAAVLRSLSAAASSLARNLDLLAGDIEHAERAAAARRQPPSSLLAGLTAGLTNFAINILGAVGGLAHHSVVGVCVGEAGGGTALRRGLVGALTKPLSATADLLAYAGQGLLAQTGWDVTPQPRAWSGDEGEASIGPAGVWQRECVRWAFRLADLPAISGFRVLLDNAPLLLIITQKFLVVADPHTERIVEMIDLKSCSVQPLVGHVVELVVKQRRSPKTPDSNGPDEDNEYQISASAMARVARYTGAGSAGIRAELEGGAGASTTGAGPEAGARNLLLRTAPTQTYSLHATLCAAIQHNCAVHFPLL